MPSIHTLIEDIFDLLKSKPGWFTDELANEFAHNLSRRMQHVHNAEREHRLRLSQMGPRCPKALWLSVNAPELAEPLQGKTLLKFDYGHMLEEYILMLAKAAGHSVEGMQDEIVLNGVLGHRDAVVDGCLVDVKSANSRSFEKYKTGRLAQDDRFGYLDQLDGYALGSAGDPLVRVKDKAYILAVDQELGGLCLYEHQVRKTIVDQIEKYKGIVALNKPPACECRSVEDGKSGNMKLDVAASYSQYKWECFPHLRHFIYADGPRWLSKVVREPLPTVLEKDRHGNIVQRGTNGF